MGGLGGNWRRDNDKTGLRWGYNDEWPMHYLLLQAFIPSLSMIVMHLASEVSLR